MFVKKKKNKLKIATENGYENIRIIEHAGIF